jgi:hypothetical protein
MVQKEILVFADWKGLDGPLKIGSLQCISVKGKEIFSFEYDKDWIGSGKYHLLDPDLKLLSGPQYPGEEKINFGLFLDSTFGGLIKRVRLQKNIRDDLLSVEKQMNIKKDRAIIERVRSVIGRWSYYAAEAGISQEQAKAIGSVHLLS